MTLDELYQNPKFVSASYEVQQAAKQKFFSDYVLPRSDVQALGSGEKQQLLRKVLNKAPAMEGLGGISLTDQDRVMFDTNSAPNDSATEYKRMAWLKERADAGDNKAADEIGSWITVRRMANETLIGQTILGAKDVLEETFGTDTTPELARNRKNLAKVSSWLISGLSTQKAESIKAGSTAGATIAGFAETIALNTLLIGSAGAPGLLTKGLFNSLLTAGKAATTPLGKTVLKAVAPLVAEATGSGAIDVIRSLPQLVNEGAVQGDKETWQKLTQTFGEGMAWDMIFSGAIGVVQHVARPYIKSMREMDVTDAVSIKKFLESNESMSPENFRKFLNDYLGGPEAKEVIGQLDPKGKADWLKDKQRFLTIRSTNPVEWNTPEGLAVYAKAALHDVEFEKDGLINIFRHGEKVAEATTLPEAASYISGYLRNSTPDTVLDDAFAAAGRASAPDVTLRRTVTGKLDTTQLGDSILINAMSPNSAGVIEPKNVKGVAKTYLKKFGFDGTKVETEVIPHDIFFSADSPALKQTGSNFMVPDKINSAQEDKLFLNYFSTRVEELARNQAAIRGLNPNTALSDKMVENLHNLQTVRFRQDSLNPYALQGAVEKLGGKFRSLGGSYEVNLPENAPQTFTSLQDANRAVAKAALDAGAVNEDSFKAALESTGRELRVAVQEDTGISMYTVRRFDGSIEVRGETIESLVEQNPEYLPKLPEELAPTMTFVDDSGTVQLTNTFSAGSQREMRKMLDNFTSYSKIWKRKTPVVVESLADGSQISVSGKTTMQVEIPSIGFRKEFSTLSSAKKFLKEDAGKLDTIEQIAYAKGFRLDVTPSGDVMFRDGTGKTFLARDRKALDAILRDAPDPSFQPDLVQAFSKEIDAEIAAKAAEKLKVDPSAGKYDFVNETPWRTAMHETGTYLGAFFRPMRSTLERVAKLSGDHSIADTARQFDLRKRQLSSISRKAESLLDKVFRVQDRQINRTEASMLMKLAEIPEGSWAKAAKNLDFDLTEDHVKLLKRHRQILNFYGERFGVDMGAMLSDYAPKIRAFMLQLSSDPEARKRYASVTKAGIINEIFAGRPDAIKTVNFFAKHTRLDTFISAADNKNIVTATKFYIEHGLREQYLAKYIDQARDWLKNVSTSPNVNEADLSLLRSYFSALTGEGSTDAQKIIGNRSLAASSYLANMIRKLKVIPGKNFANAIDEFADNMITLDMPSKIQSLVTYSTLGARPIRGLTNMMQYMNTMTVFGKYADDAVGELNRDSADVYIKKMFSKGLLNERIFASGAESPMAVRGLLERSLRGQQNMEYLTRAWTARAAEMAFDENLPLYAAGKIDFNRFVKLSNMDILSDDALRLVKEHISSGNPEAARDLFQADAIRLLMFDYGKENYPLAFKGVMGRMFGKFGVYPMGQIDLYHNLLTRGDAGTRTIRGLRMIAQSVAIYEAFKMVGLDYSGFLFYDPFNFSGGPLYQATQDLLNSRDTGPTGAMARRDLARSWRLAVPFALQGEKMASAIESGVQGNLHKALIEGMSGKYTPDSLLTGVTF